MRNNIALTVASLLTILFMTIHITQDIQNGVSPRGMFNVVGVVILAVWMYGTLMLAGRPSGYIIIFLGSLLSCYGAYLHFRGAGIAPSHDAYFVWTLFAFSTTAIFSILASARGLWSLRSERRSSV